MSNINETVPFTFDEKVKAYMKLSKLELAKMLAERDMALPFNEPWQPKIGDPLFPNTPYDPPYNPYSPFNPWAQPYYVVTTSGTNDL